MAVFGASLSVFFKKLTKAGGLAGFVVALLIYFGLGWWAILLMGAFFLMATAATAVNKIKEKEMISSDEASGRTAGQVLANGDLAALCGTAAILFPHLSNLWMLLLAAAFSSAAADTVSSELGTKYGSRFYDVLKFRKGQKGDNGVISLEGLLFGLFASLAISILHGLNCGCTYQIFVVLLAGLVGNLTDSVLGATLERRGLLTNNWVNFLNTLAAAIFAFLIY